MSFPSKINLCKSIKLAKLKIIFRIKSIYQVMAASLLFIILLKKVHKKVNSLLVSFQDKQKKKIKEREFIILNLLNKI